jgi:hypothetical protein
MKKYLLSLFIAVPLLSSAQFEARYSYVFNSPQNYMRSSLTNAHGFAMEYYKSVKNSNYFTGIGFQVGVYGYNSEPIAFQTTDGGIVNTNLNITNSFNNWSIYHKYRFTQFEKNGSRLIPFIEGKTGWSFFRTNLFIEDPNDIDNCAPLEQAIMQKDNTWNVYAGAGFDLKISHLRNPEKHTTCSCPKLYFSSSVGFHYGGKVSYMNVDRDGDNTSGQHNHGTSISTDGEKEEFYTTWVNNQTQVEHQHHTGYLYTSPLRMLEIKAGFTLRF